MKIGFVLDDTLDTADGVQQYVLLLGAWLTGQGHEVHYLTTKSTRQDLSNLHSLGKHLKIKFNRNVVPLVLPSSPKQIATILQREQFDILHVQLPYSPAFGARVISLAPKSTAIIGTFHIAPYSITERGLSKVLGYWLKPSTVHFDEVISVSQPAKDFAKDSFGLNSVVVPNMVDIKSFKLRAELNHHEPAELIYVGRLVSRKGCAHFIRSLSSINSPFKATIVGQGSQRAALEQLVNKLDLTDKVVFKGHVTEAQKRKLLSRADVAVFPATGGESFGIVLIEAMAAGSCVVLAGDNPGYRSVVGSVPMSLVEPTNHKTFAAKIDLLINDQVRAGELYENQQKLVQQYDVEMVAARVYGTYQTAVAKRLKKTHTRG